MFLKRAFLLVCLVYAIFWILYLNDKIADGLEDAALAKSA